LKGDDPALIKSYGYAAFTPDIYGHVSERMKEDSEARMQNYID
jgi:hypothetical protein